jgi:hypothetical protein
VDPIHPIAPGPLPVPPGMTPVERLPRISRERDRPQRKRREQARQEPPPEPQPERGEDDEGRPHIDIRA